MNRKFVAAAATLAAACGGALVSPAVAEATPSNCSTGAIVQHPEGGWAQCTTGSGHFRSLIYCTADPTNGWGVYATGPWELANSTAISSAFCPGSDPYVVSEGYDVANW